MNSPHTIRSLLCAALLVAFIGCGKSDEEWLKTAEQQAAHQQWPDAIESYRAIIQAHPDGPHASEAMFKTGMIQYGQLKDIAGGARTFELVTARFPTSNEAPKALMILGFLFSEEPTMQNVDSSKKYYQQLLRDFPNHELARGAQVELEHVGEHTTDVPDAAVASPRLNVRSDSLQRSPSARALAH